MCIDHCAIQLTFESYRQLQELLHVKCGVALHCLQGASCSHGHCQCVWHHHLRCPGVCPLCSGAVCCRVLQVCCQCVASVLQRVAASCSVAVCSSVLCLASSPARPRRLSSLFSLHCVAVYCSVLLCVAVYSVVLQRVAVCYSELPVCCLCYGVLRCVVLQCVAVCCVWHLHLRRAGICPL